MGRIFSIKSAKKSPDRTSSPEGSLCVALSDERERGPAARERSSRKPQWSKYCGPYWHIEGAKINEPSKTPPVIRTGAHAWAWRLRPIHGSHGFRLLGVLNWLFCRFFRSVERFRVSERCYFLLFGLHTDDRSLGVVRKPLLRFLQRINFSHIRFRFYVFGAFDPAPFDVSRLG